MAQNTIPGLQKVLEDALPANVHFCYHHISTPPTRCSAIFAAPPASKPQRTYCESHFLNVSVPLPGTAADKVSIFAIELLLYTTKTLTTVFVSKADSTGYVGLLNLPRGTPSPLRTLTATYITHIIQQRQRSDVKLVLTLFARAANQYLFPGSSENEEKHVSDDRQLVKWWCRVVDPLMRGKPLRGKAPSVGDVEGEVGRERATEGQPAPPAQAYLTVPGEDSISSFLPNHVKFDVSLRSSWKQGHPLFTLAPRPAAPPRSLVPRFPDDPKARFLDELDEELRDSHVNSSQNIEASPSKRGTGQWKSIKTLDQFWEMMAFRQECSSGRLVGFLWVVFPLAQGIQAKSVAEGDTQDSQMSSFSQASEDVDMVGMTEDSALESQESAHDSQHPSSKRPKGSRRRKGQPPSVSLANRSGPIIPRMPRIKSATATSNPSTSLPANSDYYYWPEEGRGQLVLTERDYKKALEILLRLDFANLDIAAKSSKIWADEVGVLAGTKATNWGQEIIGKQEMTPSDERTPANSEVSKPVTMMVTKKKKIDQGEAPVQPPQTAMMITKKRKQAENEEAAAAPSPATSQAGSGVNVLGAGLVRKKPRPVS